MNVKKNKKTKIENEKRKTEKGYVTCRHMIGRRFDKPFFPIAILILILIYKWIGYLDFYN
jgi:hypothetical protein